MSDDDDGADPRAWFYGIDAHDPILKTWYVRFAWALLKVVVAWPIIAVMFCMGLVTLGFQFLVRVVSRLRKRRNEKDCEHFT